VIDGIVAPEEWASARREPFLDGSELFLMHAGGYPYLGIRANTPGTINVRFRPAQGARVQWAVTLAIRLPVQCR